MLRTTPLLLLACIALASPARAHTVTTPRMVHVRVLDDRIEVAVAWRIHAGPRALHLRTRFDRDGDGTLSDEEQNLIAAWLQRRVDTALRLRLDGLPLNLEVGAIDLELTRHAGVDDEGLQFKSRSAILLCARSGGHELSIEDRPEKAAHSVPLRVDVVWEVTGSSSDGEALPLAQREPGVLGGGGFTGKGGRILVRFDVPEPRQTSPQAPDQGASEEPSSPPAGPAAPRGNPPLPPAR